MDTVTHLANGVVYAGRFQGLKAIKSGQDTATLLGRDLRTGEAVIIKTASALAPDARIRLEHEARVLVELACPEFRPLIASGHQGDVTYIVMPFVQGATLAERLNRGPLSLPEVLTVGRALARTLERAHDYGVVHRDIKPSNVIVDDGAVLSSATLIDFGFARSTHLDASIRDIGVGTLHYLSPEQAGLLSRPVDERSDLYAVGVVLFECVSGRVPFTGESPGEILRAHLCASPPELRSLGCDVPRALDEIIQRLLRKDPDDRYQTAGALAADLAALSDAAAHGVTEPAVVVGVRDRRQTLAEPAFVGRDDELALLDSHLAHAQEGRGGLVFVEAESGNGKTRLLEEFAHRCARGGAWVLRGQAVDQAAVRPFQLLDGVILGVARRLEHDTEFRDWLREALGDQRVAVCVAAPQLARYLGGGPTISLGQEAHGEIRSLRALTALLNALGGGSRPAVILLDDAQWADDLTLKLLEYRQRRAGEAESPVTAGKVLIVVAFRPEEVPQDHALRSVAPIATVTLGPFSEADLRLLVESMAGPLPDAAVEVIIRLADWSPFMASAILQGLVEVGALVPSGEDGPEASAWRIDAPAMERVRSSRRAAVLLARRLDHLPPATRRLLSVAAVLGKEFALDLAGDLAGLAEHQAAAACRDAARRHLVWIHDNGARCVFVHDKIREAFLGRLSEDERRDLHAAAAERIQAEDPARVFELSYHFDNAGQSELALPYAIRAAEQARARCALSIAEQHYRVAERGVSADDRTNRARIAEGLGDVLMLEGMYDEAERHLETAQALISDKISAARLDLKVGELALKRGDVKQGTEAMTRGLERLGRRVPKTTAEYLVWGVWEAAVQCLHTLFPSLFVGRLSRVGAESELLAIRLLSRLAYVSYFVSPVAAVWAHLRELNLAERYPPTRELGQAYSNHAPCMVLVSLFGRGIRYAERSLKLRQDLGDLWGQGQALSFCGYALMSASRLSEAAERLHLAVRVLDQTGDRWEANNASLDLASCLFRMGRLREAVGVAMKTHQAAFEIGEPKALGASLDIWARASGGAIPQELVEAELQRASEDSLTVTWVLEAEGLRLLGKSRATEAVETLEKAWGEVKRSGLRTEDTVFVSAWLATALRSAAEGTSHYRYREGAAIVRRAQAAVRMALRLARRYRNNLPHALREAGLIAAMQGKPRKARKHLDQSLSVAEQQGAKFERAQTLWARGQVGEAVGWADAAADLEQGRTALRDLGAYWVLGEREPEAGPHTITPALLERFDGLLRSGRQIASALTREAVWSAVRDSALELLGGEECVLLSVAGGVIQPVTPGPMQLPPSYSRSLVEQAVQTRRAVVASVGLGDEPSESVVLSGARSVLCAPIAVKGEVAACFYLTHRHVDGLFGPNEERLSEFIATLAGAALENVEGVAQAERDVVAHSTAGLAHAIKNPVAVLRAYLGMLRGSPEQRRLADQYLGTMDGALDRISELVARLQGMQVKASEKAAVCVGRLIDEAVAEVRPLFSEKAGYHVDWGTTDAMATTILADGEQLRLVMVNLLVNAHQAMPRGGRVGITVGSDPGQTVEITVSDEGAGICPSIKSRLFEPFVTNKADGTGLGLWVCKKIVEEQHQGRIEVNSVPGGGTTVRVTLPVGPETPPG